MSAPGCCTHCTDGCDTTRRRTRGLHSATMGHNPSRTISYWEDGCCPYCGTAGAAAPADTGPGATAARIAPDDARRAAAPDGTGGHCRHCWDGCASSAGTWHIREYRYRFAERRPDCPACDEVEAIAQWLENEKGSETYIAYDGYPSTALLTPADLAAKLRERFGVQA